MSSISEFEREMMLERQREDIAKVKELAAQNVGAAEISRQLGIGRASVYRILAD